MKDGTQGHSALMMLYLLLVTGVNFSLGFALGVAWLRLRQGSAEPR